MSSIVPIVEGFGDVLAVPELLRRVLGERLNRWDVTIAKPIRLARGKLAKEGEIERASLLARIDRQDPVGIVVVMDLDDDTLEPLSSEIAARSLGAAQLPVCVCFAVREFEAWLLGAKESLRGIRGIRMDAVAPVDPEAIRDAKGHLERNMQDGRKYVETADQVALAAQFDLAAAEATCPSFVRLIRCLEQMLLDIPQDDGTDEDG